MEMSMWPEARTWSAPPPVPAAELAYTRPMMDQLLPALWGTYQNLTKQCAVSSLGHYVPGMSQLPGFAELHRENYAVSYHLTTAIGAVTKILEGSREPGYFGLLASCLRAASEHEEKVTQAFSEMVTAAPERLLPLMHQLNGLLRLTSGTIQYSINLAVSALGSETFAALVQWEVES